MRRYLLLLILCACVIGTTVSCGTSPDTETQGVYYPESPWDEFE